MRFLTAGETHGKGLTAIVDGFPSNVTINIDNINNLLSQRQEGYGRGGRMQIETDTVEFLSGVRDCKTLGSPISMFIKNRDFENWQEIMSSGKIKEGREVYCPRPGHADLTGGIKYNHNDLRNVLERASARETAERVAVGALCMEFLSKFGIKFKSHIVQLGNINASGIYDEKQFEKSELRCCDSVAEEQMKKYIDNARENGDSVGGVFEVIISRVPLGLGSYTQWDKKLDARLAKAIMSIQAIKGIEFGMGFGCAENYGSAVHDEIISDNGTYRRKTNNAGGIEGGMSNGEDIIIRAAMKPIPTLYKPLETVNIKTGEKAVASVERSDICALPAASVVGMCAAAFEIADAFTEKFSSDNFEEIKRNFDAFLK